MFSVRPIAACLILSVLLPAIGLADQVCPAPHQINLKDGAWQVLGSGWQQSNDYSNAKSVGYPIAVTAKLDRHASTYRISCIYRANGGGSSYLILERQFKGQPNINADWKQHVCLSAQKLSCDYHCEAKNACSW